MTRPLKLALRTLAILLLLAITLAVAFYTNPLFFADLQIRNHLRQQHVQSHYVQVDGYNLHYFEAQPAHSPGTPLILIHGLGARGEDWSPLIPTLAAQGFHVYAPDLLGYGRSPRPDVDYSISLQEQTIVDFLQTLHIPPADVAGWSMGGWIALKLTIDHPQLVTRLIAMDSAGIYFPPTFTASLFTPTDAPGLTHLIAMLTPRPMHLPPFVQRAAIRKLQANSWVIHRSVASMIEGHDLLDFQLSKIKVPTLIIWGQQDALIPLAVGQQMHQQIPNSSLLAVEGCGHLAPAECYHPILKATVQFLRTTPPPTPYTETVPAN